MKVDEKRKAKSQKAKWYFNHKTISAFGLAESIKEQILTLPFPVQELIANEAKEVVVRLETGKLAPGLDSPECHCLFFRRYLLPCRHILHEHLFGNDGNNLLTDEVWLTYRRMYNESGMDVYRSRELIEVPVRVPTEEEQNTERFRLKVNELLELARSKFWDKMEQGDEGGMRALIGDLERIL